MDMQFHIQRIYTKDISFEAPSTPEIFKITWDPKIKINLDNNYLKLSDNIYEVILRITITAIIKKEVAFLCQVKQAGIFNISGLNKMQLIHCLGSYCPDILFPYARECISNQVSRGTFPQFNLDPVNFNFFLAKHLQDQSND